jgi:site-specific recombinase XerD
MKVSELALLLESWERDLRGANKSDNTVRNYVTGVRAFLRWAEDQDRGTDLALDRPAVAAFTGWLLASGAESQTVYSRYRALRYFSKWLAAEGETERDLLLGTTPPKVDAKVVRSLTVDEAAALLKACEGRGFRERRDTAILQFMLSTGTRADETVSLQLADIDLRHGVATIRRGKGGKGRKVPLGPRTIAALDRYLRARRLHKHAASPSLWLGIAGPSLSYAGLWKTLRGRAGAAGIDGFTPHMLRHTFAVRWKRARGSNEGLKSIAGWKTDKMIGRYIEDVAAELAAEEAKHLGIDGM